MTMLNITDKIASVRYTDKNGTPSVEETARLKHEKALYTCVNRMDSVNLVERFLGRLGSIESDNLEPRIDVVLKNVQGETKTLEGVLYGLPGDLRVHVPGLVRVEF